MRSLDECRENIGLEGFWNFRVDPDKMGEKLRWYLGSEVKGDILYVPANWNEQCPKYDQYMGTVWYSRDFYVPQDWSKKIVWLIFEGVINVVKVWINGTFIGEHEGGFTPFRFRVENALKFGAKNRIVAMVDNTVSLETSPQGLGQNQLQIDWFNWGGIYRPVYLQSGSKVYISDITIKTVLGKETVANVVVEISNFTEESARGEINFRIFDAEERTVASRKTNFTCLSKGKVTLEESLIVPDAKLWSPDSPYLYTMKLSLSKNGVEQDAQDVDFGLRTIEVRDGKILLNDRPIFLKGAGRVEDFPVVGRALPGAVLRMDYEVLKNLGANSFRHCAYTPPVADVYLADRMGICIFLDLPCFGKQYIKASGPMIEKAKQNLREAVAQFKNNPSVIMYDLTSEPASDTEEGRRFIEILYNYAKELDPTRPAFYIIKYPIYKTDLAIELVDLIWIWQPHDIYLENRESGLKTLNETLDWLHEKCPNKPIIVEFGKEAVAGLHSEPIRFWTEEHQAEFAEAYWEVFMSKPYVCGAQWFVLFNYRTQERYGRIMEHQKGLYTRMRQPKLAVSKLRELFKQKGTFL